jgi:hypothetical protein
MTQGLPIASYFNGKKHQCKGEGGSSLYENTGPKSSCCNSHSTEELLRDDGRGSTIHCHDEGHGRRQRSIRHNKHGSDPNHLFLSCHTHYREKGLKHLLPTQCVQHWKQL